MFVIGSLMSGGTERQLCILAKTLVQRGWEVEVFLLEMRGDLIVPLKQTGVTIFDGGYTSDANKSKSGKLIALTCCQLRLIRRVLSWKPRIIHSFLPLACFMGAVAGRAAFTPTIVTSKRALGSHQERHPYFRYFDRVTNLASHILTANSVAVAEDTAARDNYDISRIEIIRNGVDISRTLAAHGRRNNVRQQLGLSDADCAIVFVANMIAYKGHTDLLDAVHILAQRSPRFKLYLIGEDRGIGPALKKKCIQLGIDGRVIILGLRNDVGELLAGMDIGVMASHEEGFSNALLEKLAAGLPVVATNVGGNAEALADMPDCYLVPPFDPSAMADALGQLLENIELVHSRNDARRRLAAERYSITTMVDAYEQLYLRKQ